MGKGDLSEGEVHFFSGNTLTLAPSRAPVAIISSQTLHQLHLMQLSTDLCDALHLCVCLCVPLGKGVEGSHVLMGSSCVKTNERHLSPPPPPSFSNIFFSLLRQALTQMAL